jgi:hypothetical protein
MNRNPAVRNPDAELEAGLDRAEGALSDALTAALRPGRSPEEVEATIRQAYDGVRQAVVALARSRWPSLWAFYGDLAEAHGEGLSPFTIRNALLPGAGQVYIVQAAARTVRAASPAPAAVAA